MHFFERQSFRIAVSGFAWGMFNLRKYNLVIDAQLCDSELWAVQSTLLGMPSQLLTIID